MLTKLNWLLPLYSKPLKAIAPGDRPGTFVFVAVAVFVTVFVGLAVKVLVSVFVAVTVAVLVKVFVAVFVG